MRQLGMSISTADKELEFADPKEEATYWKQVAEDLERKWVFWRPSLSMTFIRCSRKMIEDSNSTFLLVERLQEARDELDEFQEGSRELEAELETQLEQAEARQRELLSAKTRLETENESLKVKERIFYLMA